MTGARERLRGGVFRGSVIQGHQRAALTTQASGWRSKASKAAVLHPSISGHQSVAALGAGVVRAHRMIDEASDPFFIDLPAFERSLKSGRLAFSGKGRNSLFGANVLAIVVEVDVAALTSRADGPIWAVAAETRTTTAEPIRIERRGRPEVKNTALQWKQFDLVNPGIEMRYDYNLDDPFHIGPEHASAYRHRLDANLAMLDRLDNRSDWSLGEDGAHPLTELLLADHLIVDISRPFADTSFFEIERSLLDGHEHTTCGGRSLNENVMDTLYTLVIAGRAGPRVSDGVAAATMPATTTFPYLEPPNRGPLPSVRRVVARRKLGH